MNHHYLISFPPVAPSSSGSICHFTYFGFPFHPTTCETCCSASLLPVALSLRTACRIVILHCLAFHASCSASWTPSRTLMITIHLSSFLASICLGSGSGFLILKHVNIYLGSCVWPPINPKKLLNLKPERTLVKKYNNAIRFWTMDLSAPSYVSYQILACILALKLWLWTRDQTAVK